MTLSRVLEVSLVAIAVALVAGASWWDVVAGRVPWGAVGYVVAFATLLVLTRCDR